MTVLIYYVYGVIIGYKRGATSRSILVSLAFLVLSSLGFYIAVSDPQTFLVLLTFTSVVAVFAGAIACTTISDTK